GKKGQSSSLMAELGKLDPEARKARGAEINQVRTEVMGALEAKKNALEEAELNRQLMTETVDVTQPGRNSDTGALHPITRTMMRIQEFFASVGFDSAVGPEIERDFYNVEAMSIPGHG